MLRTLLSSAVRTLGRNAPTPALHKPSTLVQAFAASQRQMSSASPAALSGEIVDQQKDFRLAKDVLQGINQQIDHDSYSRLFAVILLQGKQFKVTAEDLICVQCHLPLEVGETICLEKVLLAAGTDFSIIGKPLIDKNIVRVLATVVEKTLGAEYRVFRKVQRSRYRRSYFHREGRTMLRINAIQLTKNIEH